MNVKNKKSLYSVISENIPCDKCVIIASELFEWLYDESQTEQKLIYSTSSLFMKDIIYTNIFNIAIDMIMRIIYKFSDLMKKLKKDFGVKNVLVFNDINEEVNESSDEFNDDKLLIHDMVTNKTRYKKTMMGLLITDFKNELRWVDMDEEYYELVEQFFISKYPEYINYSFKDEIKAWNENPLPQDAQQKREHRKSLNVFIDHLVSIQTVINPLIKQSLFSFVMNNLKKNTYKHLKVKFVNVSKIEHDKIFSLFPHNRTLFITTSLVKNSNILIYYNNKLYFPFIDKFNFEDFIFENIDNVEYINSIMRNERVKKRFMINNWEKLLTLIKDSCGVGVFDVNADYRYTVFEDINKLIVEKQIETLFPSFVEDKELIWIEVNEYLEQLPQWVSSFNSLSSVKLMF